MVWRIQTKGRFSCDPSLITLNGYRVKSQDFAYRFDLQYLKSALTFWLRWCWRFLFHLPFLFSSFVLLVTQWMLISTRSLWVFQRSSLSFCFAAPLSPSLLHFASLKFSFFHSCIRSFVHSKTLKSMIDISIYLKQTHLLENSFDNLSERTQILKYSKPNRA